MKVHTPPSPRCRGLYRPAGMTLIEISLVIALLLGLISVVFLGIGSYRKGADRARCKMQMAAVQKAVRSHANFQNLAINAALPDTAVFGPGLALEAAPVCPSGGTSAWAGVGPAVGTPYGDCNYVDPDGVTTHAMNQYTDITDW